MDGFIKTSLYLGTILLLGAGIYRFFMHPSSALKLSSWGITGAIFLSLGSIAHLIQTISKVLGRLDLNFIWQYATSTQHGHLTLIRLALTLIILVLLPRGHSKTLGIIFALTGLGLLATFSQLSHAAAMQGTPAMLADLIHYSAATLWSSTILFGVLAKIWVLPEFASILKRISQLALLSVILLLGTGLYASRIHVQDFHTLLTTLYGRILMLKIGVFLLVLALAALNRWYFMPHLQKRGNSLKYALVLEATLLVMILVVTGTLTTSPIPHEM